MKKSEQPRTHGSWPEWVADWSAAAAAVMVAVLVFGLSAHSSLVAGPITFGLTMEPAWRGQTVLDVPPFGDMRAATHRSPVRITAKVAHVDFEALRTIVETEAPIAGIRDATSPEGVGRTAMGALWLAGVKGLLAGLAAAVLLVLAARRRLRVVVATGLTVTMLAVVTLGGTAATWDATAFRQPTLHGALAYVPRLADVASFRIGTIERLRTEAADVARKLAAYYADERGLGTGEPLTDTVRVLHVTDLHLDAVGAELSERLAGAYDVSLVVDTGDIAILGTGAEAALVPSLVDTATPRIFIPGNHDSPEIVAAMRDLPGVTVLASGTAKVEGLTVFGAGDPMSSVADIDSQPEALRTASREAIARFEEGVRSGEPTPDIVALHTPAMRAPFLGKVGVVLSGHSHQARIDVLKGTVAINSGTTGGMPYDSAASGKAPLPHGASVLYYSTDRPHRLLAVDLIQVHTDRTVTVTRRLMDASPNE